MYSNTSEHCFIASYKNVRDYFALLVVSFLILIMIYYGPINAYFEIKGMAKAYPYVFAIIFITMGFIRILMGGETKNKLNLGWMIFSMGVVLAVLCAYHLIVLREKPLDIIASLRYYFGVFVIFYGFLQFLIFFDLKPSNLKPWMISLCEFILVTSFCLTAVEYISLTLNLASPDSFFWIDKMTRERFAEFQMLGKMGSIRSYGLASNAPILGAFSLFLSIYYYSMVSDKIRLKNIVIILCGMLTIYMSRSGTGYFLLAFTAIMFIIKSPSVGYMKHKIPIAIGLMLLIAVIISIQANLIGSHGKLNKLYLKLYFIIFGETVHFMITNLLSRISNIFFGAMNLYQFGKGDADIASIMSFGATKYYISYYDFTYVALLIEIGIVGIISYFYFLMKLIKRAFPGDAFIARWSIWVLIIGTFHNPVIFWMCCQVMVGLVLAVNIYLQSYPKTEQTVNGHQELLAWKPG